MITLCSSLSKLTLLIRLCFTSRRLKNEFITTDGTDVGVHAGNAFTHSGNSSWQRVSQLKAQIWGKHRRRDIFLRNRAALGSCKSVLWALEWTKHAGKVGTTSGQDFPGKRRIQLRLLLAPAPLAVGKEHGSDLTRLPLKELPPPTGKISPCVTLMQWQWSQFGLTIWNHYSDHCDSLSFELQVAQPCPS